MLHNAKGKGTYLRYTAIGRGSNAPLQCTCAVERSENASAIVTCDDDPNHKMWVRMQATMGPKGAAHKIQQSEFNQPTSGVGGLPAGQLHHA